MFKIEYDLGISEKGRPYIELPDDYEQNPEDRFFAIEITNYILQDLIKRRNGDLNDSTISVINDSINLLSQVGDEMSLLLYDNMKSLGEMDVMFNNEYNIVVSTITERDLLPNKNIQIKNKIFDRKIGFKVFVADKNEIYELVDGINNDNWKLV